MFLFSNIPFLSELVNKVHTVVKTHKKWSAQHRLPMEWTAKLVFPQRCGTVRYNGNCKSLNNFKHMSLNTCLLLSPGCLVHHGSNSSQYCKWLGKPASFPYLNTFPLLSNPGLLYIEHSCYCVSSRSWLARSDHTIGQNVMSHGSFLPWPSSKRSLQTRAHYLQSWLWHTWWHLYNCMLVQNNNMDYSKQMAYKPFFPGLSSPSLS